MTKLLEIVAILSKSLNLCIDPYVAPKFAASKTPPLYLIPITLAPFTIGVLYY